MDGRSSKNAWILGISVFVVAFLGVGAGIGVSLQNGSDDVLPKLSLDLEYGDVSLSECEPDIIRDTVVGRVFIDIDIYCDEDLPLCLTNDYINEKWSASAEITGYDLVSTKVSIKQKGINLGYALVDWTKDCRVRCWTDYYTGSFQLYNMNDVAVDYIALASNRWPEGADPLVPPDCDCEEDCDCADFIPGKKVVLSEMSLLKGCNLPDQHFLLKGCTTYKNTVVGTIEVTYTIPDPMDLCLTSDDLKLWSGTMEITGYDPVDGYIEIWQKNDYLGKVNVEWKFVEQIPCYTDVYTAIFTMEDGVDYIAIYSNQWPYGAIHDPDDCEIPDKEVILKPVNTYKGCNEREQMFLKIMAH